MKFRLLFIVVLFSCLQKKTNNKLVENNCIYTVKDSVKQGEYECFYDKEFKKIKDKGFYANNELDCTYLSFYENGQIKSKANYKQGERQGYYYYYDEQGNLTLKVEYIDSEKFYISGEFANRLFRYNENGVMPEYSAFYEISNKNDTLIFLINFGVKSVKKPCEYMAYYIHFFDYKPGEKYIQLTNKNEKNNTIEYRIPIDKIKGDFVKGEIIGVFDCENKLDSLVFSTHLYFNYDIKNDSIVNW